MPDENTVPAQPIVTTPPTSKLLYYSNKNKVEYLSDMTLRVNNDLLKNAENNTNIMFSDENAAREYVRGNIYISDSQIKNITKADNLLIFTGAGSSISSSGVSGKSMIDLYDNVFRSIPEGVPTDKNKDWLFLEVKFIEEDQTKKNLEILISRIEVALNFYSEGTEYEVLKLWHSHIMKTIKENCSFSENPEFDISAHNNFLGKVTTRKLSYNRTKIFTLNYDTAFEKAAEKANIVLIDGFTFSDKNTFNNDFFDYDIVKRKGSRISDEDNFLPNIAYLYKLHGSINWHYKDKQVIKTIDNNGDFVMVMPSKNKYEQSYRAPYFDMMARFQAELRKSLPSTLLIIGYSFGDDHINSMIKEAVNRSNFNIVIVSPTIPTESTANDFQKDLLKSVPQGNITFVGDYFANFANTFPVQKAYGDEELR